jgi:hypothetical protein
MKKKRKGRKKGTEKVSQKQLELELYVNALRKTLPPRGKVTEENVQEMEGQLSRLYTQRNAQQKVIYPSWVRLRLLRVKLDAVLGMAERPPTDMTPLEYYRTQVLMASVGITVSETVFCRPEEGIYPLLDEQYDVLQKNLRVLQKNLRVPILEPVSLADELLEMAKADLTERFSATASQDLVGEIDREMAHLVSTPTTASAEPHPDEL